MLGSVRLLNILVRNGWGWRRWADQRSGRRRAAPGATTGTHHAAPAPATRCWSAADATWRRKSFPGTSGRIDPGETAARWTRTEILTLLVHFWWILLYVCNWWRYCKARCDIKFSQIEGNGRTFSHIELNNSVISKIF